MSKTLDEIAHGLNLARERSIPLKKPKNANKPLVGGIQNPPTSLAGTTHNATLRPVVTPPRRIRSIALIDASPHRNGHEGIPLTIKSETDDHAIVNR